MATFLNRNKSKQKREKVALSDCNDYLENPDKIKQKVFEKCKGSWNECELLYWTRAFRCAKRQTKSDGELIITVSIISEDSRLVLIPLEFGQSIELGPLRALGDICEINNGENPTDCTLIFGDSEVTWRLNSHVDRDEFLWALCELSKSVNGIIIPVRGYLPDLDMSAHGYQARFPALFKILSASASLHDADEKEAEAMLELLDWTKPVPELQNKMRDDILTLNVEICDLLLQWEEDDPGTGGLASNRVRDTVELLTTLNHVDKELGFVDDWLGNQIDHLSEVQMEIKQIEAESGTLETSLQNLTSVKILIGSILRNLQLSHKDEEVLLRAEKNLKSVLMSSGAPGSVSPVDADRVVVPLNDALESLRRSLGTNETQLGQEYTKEDWEHLMLVSGIMEQRQKLNNIVFNYCSSVSDILLGLFSSVLRHKTLNDVSKSSSILVRRFSFSSARSELEAFRGVKNIAHTKRLETAVAAFQSKNQLIAAQRCYHETLVSFLPIVEHTLILNPVLIYRVTKSYIEATRQYLYTPLLRQLFKELQPLICPQQIVNFASLPRVKASDINPPSVDGGKGSVLSTNNAPELMLRFHGSEPGVADDGSGAVLHVWDSFMVLVFAISPVIVREEAFFQSLVPAVGSIEEDADVQSINAIEDLFSVFRERVLKTVSSPDQVNAMEILPVLVVVETLLKYDELSRANFPKTETLLDVGAFVIPRSLVIPNYVVSVLMDAKNILLERLEQFSEEQIHWIQSGKGSLFDVKMLGGISDAKMIGVFPAFTKFPIFLDHIEDLACSQRFPFVDRLVFKIGSQLLNWLYTTASQNEKYHDVILIQNLSFFDLTINSRSSYSFFPTLTVLLEESNLKRRDAEKSYLDWMISYEMPVFSSLSLRISGVEKRANRDELSLYVRRQDVIKVISSFDLKFVESSLTTMRKRLDKHFSSAEASELHLVPEMWEALGARMGAMFLSMEDIFQASYQLSFSFSRENLSSVFRKLK